MGASRPKGHVSVSSGDSHTEYISLPSDVCRTLMRKRKSGEIDPKDPSELRDIIDATLRQGARSAVLRLASRREYACQEVAEKLSTYGYDQSVANDVIQELSSAHLIDDKRFADVFVRSKVVAGWGIARIERELSRRGINARDLEGWPYEYVDPDEEFSRAVEIAHRKHVHEPNARQKLIRFLVNRGFSVGVATKAASEVLGFE